MSRMPSEVENVLSESRVSRDDVHRTDIEPRWKGKAASGPLMWPVDDGWIEMNVHVKWWWRRIIWRGEAGCGALSRPFQPLHTGLHKGLGPSVENIFLWKEPRSLLETAASSSKMTEIEGSVLMPVASSLQWWDFKQTVSSRSLLQLFLWLGCGRLTLKIHLLLSLPLAIDLLMSGSCDIIGLCLKRNGWIDTEIEEELEEKKIKLFILMYLFGRKKIELKYDKKKKKVNVPNLSRCSLK